MSELKYSIDTQENKAFMEKIGDDILRFGQKFPSPGGSSYYLGDDGTPWTERARETWITSRMCHVYSIGYMMGNEAYGKLADQALAGIRGELFDQEHDGWFAGVTPDGGILPNKQCYAHAFVILASSSAYLAGRKGAEELLRHALEVYDKYFWNEEEGLACDTWNTAFTELDPYRGVNANMHTVEAFLATADALGKEKYRIRAGRIIQHVIDWASDHEWRIPEHFSENWVPDLECNRDRPDDPFKPYGATPGHGLEWSRLITQWTMSTWKDDQEKQAPYLQAAEALFQRALADGWAADGQPGIVYTTDWAGNPVIHDRMHWTLAEGINTAAVLYRVTGKKEYADAYSMFLEYLDEIVLDHTYGNWYHQLDANNQLMGTVWPGKSDLYHAFQCTKIPYLPVEISIAKAIACGEQ